jgi:hypothetical protein
MSETSNPNDTCRQPDHHQLHICQLTKKGLKDEVAARCTEPKYICHNCNATADSAEDLCNCSPFNNS